MKYHARAIGYKIRDLLYSQHKTSHKLVVCSFGQLSTLPEPPLDTSIPALFIMPKRVSNVEQTIASSSTHVRQTYNFEILYLRPIAVDEEAYKETVDEGEAIAASLWAHRKLDGLSLAEARIVNSYVMDVIYDDPTGRFLEATLKLACEAILITFAVEVQATR
ncbi:MAG: hypothetical protein PHI12_10430 [Dehalococcoidales bacterium]|nr:hypothetical protein [Dehalococcoidales bacterium]